MKKRNLPLEDAILNAKSAAKQGATIMAFDWDKAAQIIKDNFNDHPGLIAEAGLQGDWHYTGAVIFEKGVPVMNPYTYLASNWAIPTLILSWDGDEQMEIECFTEKSDRFHGETKWDSISLAILNAIPE